MLAHRHQLEPMAEGFLAAFPWRDVIILTSSHHACLLNVKVSPIDLPPITKPVSSF